MTLQSPPNNLNIPSGRQPWPMLLGAIVSLGAVYFTGGRFFGMLILAGFIAASGLTDWRLPRGVIVSWLIRIVLFATILTTIGPLPSGRDVATWYLDPAVMLLAGLLLSAEMTLRVWQRRSAQRLAREVFLLTACIVATAAVTYESLPIHILAPLYALALILSLRGFPADGQTPSAAIRITKLANAHRIVALMTAVGIGFTCVVIYEKFAAQMDQWAAELLQAQSSQEHDSIGFSTYNTLAGQFEPYPSMDRALLIEGRLTDPYLRILAFTTLTNRSWGPLPSDRIFQELNQPNPDSVPTDRLVKFTQLQTTSSFLSLPLNAISVDCRQSIEADTLGTLRVKSDDPVSYTIGLAKSPDFQGPLCYAPNDAERKELLTVPSPTELDPAAVALAIKVAGQGDSQTKVIRLQNYLRSNHAYSLSYHPNDPTKPLSDFILNNRAAHCQYFASALVIMARAVGVPSRYVTGFYAHESYGSEGMVVRDRDAHAWAECWIDSTGWQTFDATPSNGLPDEIFANPSNWRLFWEHLLDVPRTLRGWLADALGHAGLSVAAIAAAGLAITIAVRTARTRQPAPKMLAYAEADAALMELARRFERWLSRKKIPCPPNQTWNESLAKMDMQDSPRQFTKLYAQARFGNNQLAAQSAADILNKLETQSESESDARSK